MTGYTAVVKYIWFKLKKRNDMLAFLRLTPRFKKLKCRASLELDMSQIGIVCFHLKKGEHGISFFLIKPNILNTDV